MLLMIYPVDSISRICVGYSAPLMALLKNRGLAQESIARTFAPGAMTSGHWCVRIDDHLYNILYA